jgi:hypothetical protein
MDQIIAFINNGVGERELSVSAENPLPVIGTFDPPVGGATEVEQEAQTALLQEIDGKLGGGVFVDRSGTIATGGVAQQIAAANAARRYLIFQNVSDETMWINSGVAAVANQPSLKILAGGNYEPLVPPTGTVSVISATTGKAFTCKEV